jgi:molecular chaperone GrpE
VKPNQDNETQDNSEDAVQDGGALDPGALEEARAQATAAHEALQYLAADFENYKRQAVRREAEARQAAARGVIEKLMPVLDNFNLALRHADSARDVASLKVGLDFIARQLDDALASVGLVPIVAQGNAFDPNRHEAIEEVPTEGVAPGTVIEEAQRGFLYNGEVLRPSRVKVAS